LIETHRESKTSRDPKDVELRIAKVAKAGAAGKNLLELFAFLAPEAIPVNLISDKLMERQIRDDALVELVKLSLLEVYKNPDGEFEANISQSVQLAMREHLRTHKQEDSAACSALQLIADAFPRGDDPKEARHWPACEKLLPHALHILNMISDEGGGAAPAAYLLCQAGRYLSAISDFERAEPILRRALNISRISYGSDHPAMAIHQNNLAELLKNTQRFDEAEALCRDAISINEQNFGPDHPDITSDLSNLTEILMAEATRRLTEAEPLAARVVETLRQFEKKTGQKHPKYTLAHNNLVAIRHQLAEQLNGASKHELQQKSQISELSQTEQQSPKAAPAGKKKSANTQSDSPGEEWYIIHDGDQSGPFSQSELQQLISKGKISPDDLIRRRNVTNWLRFDQLILHSHDLLRMLRDENTADSEES